ncbi:hypothetical protein FB451DRAFT_1192110 [Mycena latifolia]|nr:hypothetical protein FB451DRAFT_1192110 [Mycena latifolia]
MSEPQLQSFTDNIVRPMLFGAIIQQFLLRIIANMTCRYFWRFGTKDSKSICAELCLVGALFILNAFEAGMVVDVVPRTSINEYFENIQTWTTWAQPAVMAVIVFLAQLPFLKWCWKFTIQKKRWGVLAFLFSCPTSDIPGLGSGVKPLVIGDVVADASPIVVWLVMTFMTDMSIWGVLILAAPGCIPDLSTVMRSRVALQSMNTIFSVISVVGMTELLASSQLREVPGTAYYLVTQFSISRVHMIAALAALLWFRADDTQTDCLSTLTSHFMEDREVEVTMVTLLECKIPVPEGNRPQDSAV